MPNYEYRCECGHATEEWHGFGAWPGSIACSICQKPAAKQVSMPKVYYRGPGFTTGGYDYEAEAEGDRAAAGEA